MNDTIQKFTIVLFKLPDRRVILQRRTKDAPYGPGKLGIFGGWVEENETPDECIAREIEEETSLDASTLSLAPIADFIIPADKDSDKDRHFYLYEAEVPNLDFEVYEGDGAEAFTIDELKQRTDLLWTAEYTFANILS